VCAALDSRDNCGGCGVVCATNEDCCAGSTGNVACTSVLSTTNCGGCGVTCNLANATPVCLGGSCHVQACNAGYVDCNQLPSDGCEANLASDNNNCGGCGIVCTGGLSCSGGKCV
jgi:hypothetical protein